MEHVEKKKRITSVFDKASEGYDSPALDYFVRSARHMVSDMRLMGDEDLLDVATGTGHVAVAAALELKNGSVTGIDISGKMLERARKKADALDLRNVTFKCCDIEDMGFPDNKFDLASCAFGLFFLPDMEAGLRSIFKVIKPGGRLYLTSFREGFLEPMRGMLISRLKGYGIEPPELSFMRLDRPDKIRGLLQGAGCKDIAVQSRQLGYFIKDGQQWLNSLWNTAFRGLLGQLCDKDLKEFTREHLREVDSLRGKDGIWLNVEVLFAEAAKHVPS